MTYIQNIILKNIFDSGIVCNRIHVCCYYLVHNVNLDSSFIEEDITNNKAWTEFIVTHKNNGQVQITETGNTSCDLLSELIYKPALCREVTANRG